MAKTNWKIDAVHSSIEFSIKHMMIAKAKGGFEKFSGNIHVDPDDLTGGDIEVTIDVASIDTRQNDRDDHLRSADFFDVENYPEATFVSTEIKKKADNHYEITGDLTLRGITKPVTIDTEFAGQSKDPMSGNEVIGFSGTTQINRKDFDLTWNTALETGGVLLGDEVTINIELEAYKEA
ncbi:MAG TPA: YceI family protein [Bacillota bacterium]|nr:YceI family protein [Bacillota bacterium]